MTRDDRGAVVLLDVLGAPSTGGGMHLYATELIDAWLEAFPDDDLIVLGGAWVATKWQGSTRVSTVVWPDGSAVWRFMGQVFASAIVAARRHCDAVLSVSPIVSPFIRGARTGCVVHDWRHIRRPEEFSRAQTWYRKLWVLSVSRADRVFAVSEKTALESRAIAPAVDVTVVPNGRDHPRRWDLPTEQSDGRTILTYAQHSNKRPDLVVNAFAGAAEVRHAGGELHVVGARGEVRSKLEQLSRDAGIADVVHLHPHLAEAQYRSMLQRSEVVVLASSDEGFGLPIVEADYFGIPAVLTSDSGVVALHPNALIADPDVTSVRERLTAAFGGRGGATDPRAEPGSGWGAVASRIRDALLLR